MLEKYTQIVVSKVDTSVWMDSHPRIRENPAFAQWRSEIGVASDQIPTTAKKFLSKYYEIRGGKE